MNLRSAVWASVVGVGVAVGLIGFGFVLGGWGVDDRMELARQSAEESARLEAEARVSQQYEQQIATLRSEFAIELRQSEAVSRESGRIQGKEEAEEAYRTSESFRSLEDAVLQLRNSPAVMEALPPAEQNAIERSVEALSQGDLETAASLFPRGVVAMERVECIPENTSIVAKVGATLTLCEKGVRANIARLYENNGTRLDVGIGGGAYNGTVGRYISRLGSECSLLFEKVISIEPPQQVKVSFSCG